MKRIKPNPYTLRVNNIETLNTIDQDILGNIRELFNRTEYFGSKYRGDLLNDICLGLFTGDDLLPTARLYINNGHAIVVKTYKLNKQKTRLISTSLNIKEMIKNFEINVFGEEPMINRLNKEIETFLDKNPHLTPSSYPTREELFGIYPDKDGTVIVGVNFA